MLFRRPLSQVTDMTVETPSLVLRPPTPDDFDAWAALREDSRAFLTPWEPTWGVDDLTRGAFRRRLRRYAEEMEADEAYPFFLFRRSDQALLGGINLTNVRRGAAEIASLGYWMGRAHAGQGHMSEAVRSLMPFAFSNLRLRRIEAACLPENAASIRLLEKIGFRREGYARDYLSINGAWRDHLLFALLARDVNPPHIDRAI